MKTNSSGEIQAETVQVEGWYLAFVYQIWTKGPADKERVAIQIGDNIVDITYQEFIEMANEIIRQKEEWYEAETTTEYRQKLSD